MYSSYKTPERKQSEQPGFQDLNFPELETFKEGTVNRNRLNNSTPLKKKRQAKKVKETAKETKNVKMTKSLSEEETRLPKSWHLLEVC